jgi:sec-independent protein translocase protein TatB
MPDMLFILVLALVILGPSRLPGFARQLGRYKAKFREIQRELTSQIEVEMNTIGDKEMGNAANKTASSVTERSP